MNDTSCIGISSSDYESEGGCAYNPFFVADKNFDNTIATDGVLGLAPAAYYNPPSWVRKALGYDTWNTTINEVVAMSFNLSHPT